MDVVEVHAALYVGQRGGLGGVGGLLLLVQELKDPLGGGGHGLEHVGDLCNLGDGLGEVLHVLDEGLDVAYHDDTVHGQHAAGHGHGHITQVAHKVHDGLHHAGEELALPGGLEQDAVGLVKFGLDGLLLVEGPDDVVPGVALLHLTVDVAQVLLLGLEVLLGVLHHHADEQHGDGQDDDGDEGHQGADGEHHDEHADDHGHRGDELGDALVEALAHGVHVVGDAGEDLAHGAGLKVLHGHAVDLFRDIPAHAVGHLLGDAAHDPALDGAEEGGDEVHAQEEEEDLGDAAEVDAAGAADFGQQAVEQLRGGVAQDFGPKDIEHGGTRREEEHKEQSDLVPAHVGQELADGALEVLGLLAGPHAAVAHASHGAPAGRGVFCLAHAPSPPNSAAESWLLAIS